MDEDDPIQRYYDAGLEAQRLFQGSGRLERARTQEILARVLPPAPARLLDVGGGTGVYARWLAGGGYEVHLLDAVARHVEEARTHDGPALAGAAVGDARHLDHADRYFDGVTLLGPLYHLVERTDRVQALAEARRVLRPGGVVVVAAISRHASLLDGLFRGLVDDPEFAAILERDLCEGQHRNPTARLDYFTTAFFHRPTELAEEARAAGLGVDAVLGVEGPAWLIPDLDSRWADEPRRLQLLGLLRRLEADPAALAMSAHLVLVARRP